MANKWQEISITKLLIGEKTTLENGLTVCLIPNTNFKEAHAMFTTRYGSNINRFINPQTNEWYNAPEGVAHFLEHKLFDQPDGSDVFLAFSKIGASANAYTSHTQTSYIFSTNQNVEVATEILLDYVQTPFFTEESVNKEKGIIEQEIKMYDDQFNWVGYRMALAQAYPNHPAGIDIAGTVESIYAITPEDLYTCYQTFYHPSNMQIILCGNFDLAVIKKVISDNQNQKTYNNQAKIIIDQKSDCDAPVTKAVRKSIDAQTNYVTVIYKDICKAQENKHPIYQELVVDIILDMLFSDVSAYYSEFIDQNLVDTGISFYSNYEENYGYLLTQVKSKKPSEFIEKYKSSWYEGTMMTREQFNRVKKLQIGTILQSEANLQHIMTDVSRGLIDDITPIIIFEWLEKISFDEVIAKYQEIVSRLDDYLTFVLLEGKISTEK